ncbi:MAG: LysM peptidoglycan-binding domain-containing protein [Fervidobacterium sp.]
MAGDKRVRTLIIILSFLLIVLLTGCFPLGNYLSLSLNIDELNRRVDQLENAYKVSEDENGQTGKTISDIKRNLAEVQNNLKMLQSEIDYLYTAQITYSASGVTVAENRLKELENKVANLSVQISDVNKRLNTLVTTGKNYDDLNKKVSDIQNDIAVIKQSINDVSKGLKTNSDAIAQLSKKTNDLETKTLSDLTKRVLNLEKNVVTTDTKLASLENQMKSLYDIRKDLDVISAQLRDVRSNMQVNISQSDIQFLKQLQQQIEEIKSTVQSLSIEEMLKLKEKYIYYVVKSGDTLSSIANAYGVKVSDLSAINNISDPSKLYIGQMIKIPIDDPSQYVRVPLKIDPSDILSYHGQEKNSVKTIGMDIYARGKDIYPILPGKVLNVENNTVSIDHGNMIMAIYSGINTSLKAGAFVTNTKPLGQCIDVFHFELYIDGEPRDPIRLFTQYKGIFTVTFYTEWDDGKVSTHPTFRISRNGRIPQQFRTIAVDPTVIPLGSLVYIPTLSNTIFIAEDTGSAIKGNRIDVYVSDVRLALNQGITPHPVYIIYPEKNIQ